MTYRLDEPAQLKFTGETVTPPTDWSDAEAFATLREALEAAIERLADAPWIQSGTETIKPADVDDLWKTTFRPLSD